jgi:glycosyltransferase involved in cell wall biosynthesis
MAIRFSIIVPTRNRIALLDACLGALTELETPQTSFEVIVVDDGSNPPPTEVLARFAQRLNLRTLRSEGVGPARARNLALGAATGEYVAFTDDDCRPRPQWLSAFEEAILHHTDAGFGGAIVDAPQNGLCGRASQMLVSFLYGYNQGSWGLRFFCSNNLVFPRRKLLEIGGFDESFPLAAAEDRYLCARWLRNGELHFVPHAVVEHRQMLSLVGFWRQQFRYGRGACQFWKRRQAEETRQNRLEPFRFYASMLCYPFGKVLFFNAIAMSGLLALSQVAVAAGYYAEKMSRPGPSTGVPVVQQNRPGTGSL